MQHLVLNYNPMDYSNLGLLAQEILLLKSEYWLSVKQFHRHEQCTKVIKRHKAAQVQVCMFHLLQDPLLD